MVSTRYVLIALGAASAAYAQVRSSLQVEPPKADPPLPHDRQEESIAADVSAGVTSVVGDITEGAASATSIIGDAAESLTSAGGSAFDAATSAAVSIENSITSAAASAINSLTGEAGSAVEGATQTLVSVYAGVTATIVSVVGEATARAVSAGGQETSFAGSVEGVVSLRARRCSRRNMRLSVTLSQATEGAASVGKDATSAAGVATSGQSHLAQLELFSSSALTSIFRSHWKRRGRGYRCYRRCRRVCSSLLRVRRHG